MEIDKIINKVFGENEKELSNFYLKIIGLYSILKSKSFLKTNPKENWIRLKKVHEKFKIDILNNKELDNLYKKICNIEINSKFPMTNFEEDSLIMKKKYVTKKKENSSKNKSIKTKKSSKSKRSSITNSKIYETNENFVKKLKNVKSKIKNHVFKDKISYKSQNKFEVLIPNNHYNKTITSEYNDSLENKIFKSINPKINIDNHSNNNVDDELENEIDKSLNNYKNESLEQIYKKIENFNNNIINLEENNIDYNLNLYPNLYQLLKNNNNNTTINSTLINQSLNKINMFDIVNAKKNNENLLEKLLINQN